MKDFLVGLSELGPLIDIISCVFTVLALIFTLYFWLLDNLNEEETKFVEGKGELLKTLNEGETRKCPRSERQARSGAELPLLGKKRQKRGILQNLRVLSGQQIPDQHDAASRGREQFTGRNAV